MRLRSILIVLSLLAFLSFPIGGYLYYSFLQDSTFKEAQRQAATRTEIIRKNLSSFLSENIRPVKTLAGMKTFQDLLLSPGRDSQEQTNAMLDHFRASLGVDVCYLMDALGNTVASSNRQAADSFVGKNFAFRPYFKEAMEGTPSTYLALGTTSLKRGVYCSHPVYEKGRGAPIGVVVIKASIERVEKELNPVPGEIILVADPKGVVFISSRHDWLYHTLQELTADETAQIETSLQFGQAPWRWTGLRFIGEKKAQDAAGKRYLVDRLWLYHYPGWKIVHLYSLSAISRLVADPLIKIAGPIVLALCLFVGLAVFLLYRNASGELVKRKSVENALRQSEARYRSIYHNTPAMLHSVDANGLLISVSNHWLEVMGYERDDVIGQKLTRFLTPRSQTMAERTVLPTFFQNGSCKDVSYQFVKKNGETIEVLLSAFGERDARGEITRSLAVSIDVTERNRAEMALQQAKEELARYSRNLENQVQERTREITRILNQIRRLSGNIMLNQEKERAAIARELHDELGQILTALRMDLVWLSERLKKNDPKASEQALTMCSLIDKSINEVRGMAIRLRPGVLDDLGLVDALEWYTSDFERRTGISCVFEHHNVPATDDMLATAAYRITQEVLTNVARHAEASRVEVVLQASNGEMTLVAFDNGKGFDADALSGMEALGIAGMRERAALVGGVLEIQSQPGKGTRVFFKVPVKSSDRVMA